MKRALLLIGLVFGSLASSGWILVHPLFSLGNDRAVDLDGLKKLPPDTQKIMGTLNTLAYAFQFFVYGERRLPGSLEELTGSPYFPLPMTELTHPGDKKMANFFSYLAMMPDSASVGDYGITRDMFGYIHLQAVARLSVHPGDGSPPSVQPHLVEVLFGSDDLNALAGATGLTGESMAMVGNLKLEEAQTYWECALLNAASQDFALHAVPPLRPNPASVRSLGDLRASPWFANLALANSMLHRPMAAVAADSPRPGDYTVYPAVTRLDPVTPQTAGATGTLSAGKPVDIRYPAFVCYGNNLKPVNPSVLQALGINPASPPSGPASKSKKSPLV